MNKIYVSLTGGLGNQLFQLSAAMSIVAKNGEIILLDMFGKPRSTNDRPDICGFILAKNIKYREGLEAPKILRKAIGFSLRMGINPRGWENLKLLNSLCNWVISILVSIFFKERIQIVNGKDVGYSDIRRSKKTILLVGYFQSFLYGVNLKNNTEYLQLIESGQAVDDISRTDVDFSNRLIIHLRLTDYLYEEKFGIPNQNYYGNAIKQMFDLREFHEIWVFSDDIDMAKRTLKVPEKMKISWMKCEHLKSYEILSMMRNGSGYIIANSTFSWWAAYLSRCDDPIVIAPNPWFKGMPSPSHLIPSSWTTVDAWN